ncbi:MAG TPA: carbohydrate ABC transporter permease, partial [Clostridia bacterium]|nr:carbohydrate ABC transporter permease [Clostridia bacterium]
PKGLYLGGYRRIFSDARLWISYRNTIFYALMEASLMLVTCSSFAYALSCKRLRCRKWINAFLLIPMYFGGGIIPLFLLMMKLGLYNTVWSLILPGSYSIWYIILMKAYFGTIPDALKESARIDGANHFQTLLRVILPVAKPILAVIALYTIVGAWNSWFRAAVFLADQNIQPLQLYLRRVLITSEIDLVVDLTSAEEIRAAQLNAISDSQLKYTVIMVASLPMLVAYPFFQQYFVKGVMLGSLKE